MDAFSAIRPELLTLTSEQICSLSPYFWLFAGSVVAMIFSVMRVISPKYPVFLIALATTLMTACASQTLLRTGQTLTIFNDMMVADPYSNFFNLIYMGAAALTLLASFRYLDKEGIQHPEYYLLVLFSAFGMMLMTSATDLIVMFIALELMSLTVYVLVGFRRADRRANEAAMKYFILGGAASAVFLYGAALLYGATQTTNIRHILTMLGNNPQFMTPMFVLGAWFVILGFLFKVASVPFHMWMPDVYEGAPTPVTGFMTTGLKAAAFGAFVRVFISMGYGKNLSVAVQTHIHDILWVCAVLTMIVGNVVALTQTNLKRMLAYSSIAHTGYLLVGLISGSGNEQGYSPMVMYLVSYSVMNLGAFIILTIIAARNDHGLNLQDLSGLSQRHPWLAFSMAVFLFSMAGIPPTAGFAAKYLLLYSAVQANEIVLVVISVLCSAISVYYYLRVLVYMYMRDPVGAPANSRVPVWSAAAVAAMVVLTFHIGVLPARLVAASKKAISSL